MGTSSPTGNHQQNQHTQCKGHPLTHACDKADDSVFHFELTGVESPEIYGLNTGKVPRARLKTSGLVTKVQSGLLHLCLDGNQIKQSAR